MSEVTATRAHLRPGLGMVSIAAKRGDADGLALAVRQHARLGLPKRGCWAGDDALALLWSAPDQFVAVGAVAATRDFAEALRERAWLIGLTDSRVVIRLSGASARDILARVMPLDLHPRVMRPGHVASTVAAHVGVQIWQIDNVPSYDIAGPTSYAGSLLRALELAGAPVAGPA